MWFEKRQFPRLNTSLRVYYQMGNEMPHLNCGTKDISEGGVRLGLCQGLKVGTTLKLNIYLGETAQPECVFGKLVWEKQTPGKEFPYEAGIQFDLAEPTFRSRIHEYIQSVKS